MATQGADNNAMSSRLMTMKFMQRSLAATSSEESRRSNGRAVKRQKFDHPSSQIMQNSHAASTALLGEGEKKSKQDQVLGDQAIEAGDSKWTVEPGLLSQARDQDNLRVVNVGFATIDNYADERATARNRVGSSVAQFGRRSFGNFNPGKEDTKYQDHDHDFNNQSGDESDVTGSASYSDSNTSVAVGDTLVTVDKAEKHKSIDETGIASSSQPRLLRQNIITPRVKKLSSISTGGSSKSVAKSTPGARSDKTCFTCGRKGHKKIDCPNRQQ